MTTIYTQNGSVVPANAHIVVAENFPRMTMSQWFVAVYNSVASYDSPYDPIIWIPKTGIAPYPQFAEAHAAKHASNKEMAELIASVIRAELASQREAA